MEAKGIFHLFESDRVRNFKRILSVFLSCTLLLGLLPAVSFAEDGDSSYADGDGTDEAASLEGETQSGTYNGEGTAESPYEISTAEQLAVLATEVNDGTGYDGKYLKLMNDIDLSTVCGMDINGSEVSWTPIGKKQ